jgi:hypothetical protein
LLLMPSTTKLFSFAGRLRANILVESLLPPSPEQVDIIHLPSYSVSICFFFTVCVRESFGTEVKSNSKTHKDTDNFLCHAGR